MSNVISLESLSKRYGSRIGIDGVQLNVVEGQIFGFLGPNGAGKSTTIRLLLGLVRPSADYPTFCFRRKMNFEPTDPLSPFLLASETIDWHHRDVAALADRLRAGSDEELEIAQRCFEWVRDNIEHSVDFQRHEVTRNASDVLKARTGFCYAKSHLLAALLRANRIPAGFCYQRLSIDGAGPPFCLHGLNAIYLKNHGWYRVDARGDKRGVSTGFSPPVEQLAFPILTPGEVIFPEVWTEPLPVVLQALRTAESVEALQRNLPDMPIIDGL